MSDSEAVRRSQYAHFYFTTSTLGCSRKFAKNKKVGTSTTESSRD